MKWLLALLMCMATEPFAAANADGSICVAPILSKTFGTAGTAELLCRPGIYAYRLDRRPAVRWSHSDSALLEHVEMGTQHRIVLYCDGKPNQSFRFTLTQVQSRELCLFLNDLYQTPQLWDRKSCRWCKCK